MDWSFYVKIGMMCVAVFAAQLAICIKASKVMTKLWPVIILTGLEIVCGIIVLTLGVGTTIKEVISGFAFAQLLLVGGMLILVDLAWLVYGIIWLIKKMINKSKNETEV